MEMNGILHLLWPAYVSYKRTYIVGTSFKLCRKLAQFPSCTWLGGQRIDRHRPWFIVVDCKWKLNPLFTKFHHHCGHSQPLVIVIAVIDHYWVSMINNNHQLICCLSIINIISIKINHQNLDTPAISGKLGVGYYLCFGFRSDIVANFPSIHQY